MLLQANFIFPLSDLGYGVGEARDGGQLPLELNENICKAVDHTSWGRVTKPAGCLTACTILRHNALLHKKAERGSDADQRGVLEPVPDQ